jgi:hypothetical protein
MMLALVVWLVMTALPAIKGIGIAIAAICGVATVVGGITAIDYGTDNTVLRNLRKNLKWAIPVMLLGVFTPNKETSWYMIGAYATQTVVQSETGKELASDSLGVLKSLIKKSKEYIDETDAKTLAPATKAEQPKGEKT